MVPTQEDPAAEAAEQPVQVAKLSQSDAIKAVDLSLAALGVLPPIIDAVQRLFAARKRIKDGEHFTYDELVEIVSDVNARSARIQAA